MPEQKPVQRYKITKVNDFAQIHDVVTGTLVVANCGVTSANFSSVPNCKAKVLVALLRRFIDAVENNTSFDVYPETFGIESDDYGNLSAHAEIFRTEE